MEDRELSLRMTMIECKTIRLKAWARNGFSNPQTPSEMLVSKFVGEFTFQEMMIAAKKCYRRKRTPIAMLDPMEIEKLAQGEVPSTFLAEGRKASPANQRRAIELLDAPKNPARVYLSDLMEIEGEEGSVSDAMIEAIRERRVKASKVPTMVLKKVVQEQPLYQTFVPGSVERAIEEEKVSQGSLQSILPFRSALSERDTRCRSEIQKGVYQALDNNTSLVLNLAPSTIVTQLGTTEFDAKVHALVLASMMHGDRGVAHAVQLAMESELFRELSFGNDLKRQVHYLEIIEEMLTTNDFEMTGSRVVRHLNAIMRNEAEEKECLHPCDLYVPITQDEWERVPKELHAEFRSMRLFFYRTSGYLSRLLPIKEAELCILANPLYPTDIVSLVTDAMSSCTVAARGQVHPEMTFETSKRPKKVSNFSTDEVDFDVLSLKLPPVYHDGSYISAAQLTYCDKAPDSFLTYYPHPPTVETHLFVPDLGVRLYQNFFC